MDANYSQHLENLRKSISSSQALQKGLEDMAAGPTVLTGKFSFDGAGENIVNFSFPVRFIGDPPTLTFGGEMKEGDVIQEGSYPTLSVLVYGWITEEIPPNKRLYSGARLIVVTTGLPYQKMYITWQLTGTAFTNPV